MNYFYNQNKNHGYYDQPTHPTGQTMATAALILGIVAVATFWTLYLPIVCGGLGLLFAYLSKGFEDRFSGQAKFAMIFAGAGFFISIAVIIGLVYNLTENPELMLDYGRQLDQLFLQMFGQSSQNMMGNSYEETIRQMVR
ncbi:MAG: hypothetical protein FWC09_06915 [Lachnospiraceae bacterium]|nr:hypothetical protein [Lachnospiraceae bacterium]